MQLYLNFRNYNFTSNEIHVSIKNILYRLIIWRKKILSGRIKEI